MARQVFAVGVVHAGGIGPIQNDTGAGKHAYQRRRRVDKARREHVMRCAAVGRTHQETRRTRQVHMLHIFRQQRPLSLAHGDYLRRSPIGVQWQPFDRRSLRLYMKGCIHMRSGV